MEPLSILLVAGGISLVLAVVPAIVGLQQFGRDMLGNLLAEVSGVLLEVALVLLVLDWLTKRNQRREWHFAYSTISKRFAVVFVDIMRLLFMLYRQKELKVERFNNFLDVGFEHLGNLRSHIEGFAVAFEPSTHQQCRQIEQQFSWMLGRIKRGEQRRSDFFMMKKLADSLDAFLQSSDDLEYAETKHTIEKALSEYNNDFRHNSASLDVDTVLSIRLRVQDDLLSTTSSQQQQILGILDDSEMKYSVSYFVIDFLILSRLPHHLLHFEALDA